jgi:nitroreductase
MKTFLELVKNRYSLRSYKKDRISRSDIDTCLEAARLAPSACNSQPWSFIVIDEPEKKESIAQAAFSGIYSMCAFAKDAPVLIIVITERSNYAARLGQFLKGTHYNLIDIGIACEHLLLQATELGIGSCWLGWFDEKKVKKSLGLKKSVHIDTILSLGYPRDQTVPEKKRKDLAEIRKYF